MPNLTAPTQTPAGELPRAARFGARIAPLLVGIAYIPLATAETVIGKLDALDDIAAMAAGSAAIATAGLLQLLSGLLFTFATMAIWPWAARGVLARIGWWMTAFLPVGLGAFGMLHLLTLEAAAPGLDETAMQQFLVERLSEAPGLWSVPVMLLLFLALPGIAMLLSGLAVKRSVSWIAPGLAIAGVLLHVFESGLTPWGEPVSHWMIAAGLAVAAVELWRRPAPFA